MPYYQLLIVTLNHCCAFKLHMCAHFHIGSTPRKQPIAQGNKIVQSEIVQIASMHVGGY